MKRSRSDQFHRFVLTNRKATNRPLASERDRLSTSPIKQIAVIEATHCNYEEI